MVPRYLCAALRSFVLVSGAACEEHETGVERMTEGTPSSIKFYYRKGNFFRVIHADGVVGGATPERAVFAALYNQRSPIPRSITQAICPDGTLGEELDRKSKQGIFREVEVGIVLTPKAAEEIGHFLLQQARLLRDTDKTAANVTAVSEENNEHVSTSSTT